jgi:hypothetical protein
VTLLSALCQKRFSSASITRPAAASASAQPMIPAIPAIRMTMNVQMITLI